MPQDSAPPDEIGSQNPDTGKAVVEAPTRVSERLLHGLPSKLLYLTALFVMLAEVLIFVPSIANFRVVWLTDRLTAARLASLAAEAAPGGIIPENVRSELLSTAQLRSVAIKSDGVRKLVLPPDGPFVVDAVTPGTDVANPAHACTHLRFHKRGDEHGRAGDGVHHQRWATEFHAEIVPVIGEVGDGIGVGQDRAIEMGVREGLAKPLGA